MSNISKSSNTFLRQTARISMVAVLAGGVSGCITLFGPSMTDYGSSEQSKFPASGNEATQRTAANTLADATKTKFEDWRAEYVQLNRGAAGALSILGYGGAIAAGYDASKDVLKAFGFGAAGVITFEDFMQTKNGADILIQGRKAVECAIDIANGKIATNTNGLKLARAGVRNTSESLNSIDLLIELQDPSKLAYAELKALARYQALTEIAKTKALRTVKRLDAAITAIDVAKDGVGHELWLTVKGIRGEVVSQLQKDAVDLAGVFKSVRASSTKLQTDLLADLNEAKNAAKNQDTEGLQKASVLVPQIANFLQIGDGNSAFLSDTQSGVKQMALTASNGQTKSIDAQAADASNDAATAAGQEATKLERIIKKCETPSA